MKVTVPLLLYWLLVVPCNAALAVAGWWRYGRKEGGHDQPE
jgi:hypothetical protein